MFTGIIECLGRIERRSAAPGGAQLTVRPQAAFEDLRVGESIAVSGVCLTAEADSMPDSLNFFLSDETLSRSKLGRLRAGDAVNLERSLRADGRLGGHLVMGHVDGLGRIRRWETRGDGWELEVAFPPELGVFLAPKGSIAVDGISLTIVDLGAEIFTVAVIPHTAEVTALQFAAADATVNLEVDMLARYVVRALGTMSNLPKSGRLTEEFLRRAGFDG